MTPAALVLIAMSIFIMVGIAIPVPGRREYRGTGKGGDKGREAGKEAGV